jgi:hypothetical protein
VAAVAGAAGLLLVLVTWAASIGPDDVLRKPGRQAGSSFIVQPSQSASNGIDFTTLQRAHQHSSNPPAWLKLAAILFEVLAFVAVVYVTWRLAKLALVAWRGRRRLQTRDAERVEFDVLDDPERLKEALREGADEQFALLERGEPRNAIVACWHQFEVSTAEAGLARKPWQTTSEFVLRLLDAVGADDVQVNRLAALYREARFSDHPVTEDQRHAAIDALAATDRSLGKVPAGSRWAP